MQPSCNGVQETKEPGDSAVIRLLSLPNCVLNCIGHEKALKPSPTHSTPAAVAHSAQLRLSAISPALPAGRAGERRIDSAQTAVQTSPSPCPASASAPRPNPRAAAPRDCAALCRWCQASKVHLLGLHPARPPQHTDHPTFQEGRKGSTDRAGSWAHLPALHP